MEGRKGVEMFVYITKFTSIGILDARQYADVPINGCVNKTSNCRFVVNMKVFLLDNLFSAHVPACR